MGRSRFPILLAAATTVVPRCGGAAVVSLSQVAAGLDRPTVVTAAYDDTNRVFIAEKPGRIRVLVEGSLAERPFLDISGRVKSNLLEQGLVGLSFDPDFETNHLFYVAYTELTGDSLVARFSTDLTGEAGDPDSEIPILRIEQPSAIHNVNHLAFGPDGYLYVTSGDGGPAADPDNTAQDLSTPLGKLLRIEPAGTSYTVPPTNPFVGVPGAREEIWAYGLRNPARLSFDRETGDLFLGDVGQASWEEIDRQPAASAGGENYGWSLLEGTHCFDPPVDCDPGGLTSPIVEYSSATGADCAAIGGFVYRGSAEPEIEGLYLFGDFCSGKIWGAEAGCDGSWRASALLDSEIQISTFGETEGGELLVAEWAQSARLFQLTAEPGTTLLEDGFESGSLSAWDRCTPSARSVSP